MLLVFQFALKKYTKVFDGFFSPRTSLEWSSWTRPASCSPSFSVNASRSWAFLPSVRAGAQFLKWSDSVKLILNPDIERLATTHHSFLGSFSAVSKRNFATKYAFFQVFRDLQNYLAAFLKKLQNFAKNRKILQNFCEISGFSQKKCWFLRKSLIFCKILQNFWKFSQIVL